MGKTLSFLLILPIFLFIVVPIFAHAEERPPGWLESFTVNGYTLNFYTGYGGSYQAEPQTGDYGILLIQQYGGKFSGDGYDPNDPSTYTPFDHDLWFIEGDGRDGSVTLQFLTGNPTIGFSECLSKRFSFFPWGDPDDPRPTGFLIEGTQGKINGELAGAPVAGRYATTTYPAADTSCIVNASASASAPSRSGSSASSRIRNLISVGNYELAQQIANQYGVPLPTSNNPINSPAASAFSRTLEIGQSGADVKALQQYLNSKGFQVAVSGFGSIGNETNVFGSFTKKALIEFQKAHNISPTGFFGPITKAYVSNNP